MSEGASEGAVAHRLKHVHIFTDGACKGNPGPGGWAAVLRLGAHEKELTGGARDTTNNRMELTAVIRALAALTQPCEVTLQTDSRYVIDGITKWVHGWIKKGWVNSKREPVANEDLWRDLLIVTRKHKITWEWVKGHAGNPENERADRLASAEAIKAGRR
jgi:ribonuclease HI